MISKREAADRAGLSADQTKQAVRLVTVSEAELSALERAEQISEYADLAKKRRGAEGAQFGHPDSRYVQRGDSAAARDLGVTRQEVQRAATIAQIDPGAKAAAIEAGIADNQSALMKVAKEKSPAAQLDSVKKQKAVETAWKDNAARDRAISYKSGGMIRGKL